MKGQVGSVLSYMSSHAICHIVTRDAELDGMYCSGRLQSSNRARGIYYQGQVKLPKSRKPESCLKVHTLRYRRYLRNRSRSMSRTPGDERSGSSEAWSSASNGDEGAGPIHVLGHVGAAGYCLQVNILIWHNVNSALWGKIKNSP